MNLKILFTLIIAMQIISCNLQKTTTKKGNLITIDKDIQIENKGFISPKEYPNYKLFWNDEFDSSKIDSTKWNHEVRSDGGGNFELQAYTNSEKNAYQLNGFLVIKAMRDTILGRIYTSARLNSETKFSFKYGRIDIRAKLPIQQGIWPAIWLYPAESKYGSWPQSGELDLVETIGNKPDEIVGTIHFGNPWPNNKNTGTTLKLKTGNVDDGFRVYSLIWKQDTIKWLVDDKIYSIKNTSNLAPAFWPFNEPFFMIMNLAVGGNWPGEPSKKTIFPKYLIIDYLRVFKAE